MGGYALADRDLLKQTLKMRLTQLRTLLRESKDLMGKDELTLLSSLPRASVPKVLHDFLPFGDSVWVKIEGPMIFTRVRFLNEGGEVRYAYLLLGENDRLRGRLTDHGLLFNMNYTQWREAADNRYTSEKLEHTGEGGVFSYPYDIRSERREYYRNLNRRWKEYQRINNTNKAFPRYFLGNDRIDVRLNPIIELALWPVINNPNMKIGFVDWMIKN